MSELRYSPITGKWAVIAPERGRRRDDFITDKLDKEKEKPCPFCRIEEKSLRSLLTIPSKTDPSKAALIVTPNKYPALGIEGSLIRQGHGLYDAVTGLGAHEIIIDSPRHCLKAEDYSEEELFNLFCAFKWRISDLIKDIRFRYIAAFKNIGMEAGEFIPHPHAQVMAFPVIPSAVSEELKKARDHYREKERCLYCDAINQERHEKSRIVFENYDFIAFCPYGAETPFEINVYPKNHSHLFSAASENSLRQLADITKELFIRIAALLGSPALTLALRLAPPGESRPDTEGYLTDIGESYHWRMEIKPVILKPSGTPWASGMTVNPLKPEEVAHFLKEVAIK